MLLNLGAGLAIAFCLPIAVAIAFFALPTLGRLLRWAWRFFLGTSAAVVARLRDRRTYRFSITTLLIAVLLTSVVFVWLSAFLASREARRQAVQAEHGLFDGKWLHVSPAGEPIILPNGQPVIHDFTGENYTVDPFHQPKRLVFHTARGDSHAIYRWEGAKLRVKQVSPGRRPTSFRDDATAPVGKPGAGPMTFSISTYVLERVPDE